MTLLDDRALLLLELAREELKAIEEEMGELDDMLDDMFPGSGAVTQAWDEWRASILGEPEQLVMTHD